MTKNYYCEAQNQMYSEKHVSRKCQALGQGICTFLKEPCTVLSHMAHPLSGSKTSPYIVGETTLPNGQRVEMKSISKLFETDDLVFSSRSEEIARYEDASRDMIKKGLENIE